jgi:hypothetical protein
VRLKILIRPIGTVDGVSLDHFCVGSIYELGTDVASVFLAEGWVELVTDDGTPVFVFPQPPEIARRKAVVLVVNDEPDVRRLTESLLIADGYHVMVAAHGRDAIQQLREQCPDLIVLDLNMPVMDGWQFRTEQRYLTDRTRAAVPCC